jgi:transcriptional regulator with XRE-family HTH domain
MTRVERGSKNPTLAVVAKIARGLGVELSTIWIEVERRGGIVSKVTDPPIPR